MSPRPDAITAGIGTVIVVFCALVRVLVSIDPMPVWSMDPLVMWIPPAGIGPTALMTLDLVGILGAAMVLVARRRGVPALGTALLLLGGVGVVIHAARLPADAEIALPWFFAVSGAFALAHLPRASMGRSAALAAMLAVAVILVGRGVVQVFIEHPQTVESYRQTREAFLESQGWSADSAMARNYERRLFQPEASGWFGLSNVFGSIMAAMSLGLGTMGVLSLRDKPSDRRVPWILLVAATLCVFGLVLSHSKGGVGAGLLGLVAIVAATRTRGRARLVLAAVPVLVLLGIIARGLVGERIGDLSILFRWFYMQGATRIFLDHPLVGVGPAGFKDAYLLARPPLSPEEVNSAHNLLFDWLATLGLFALAWIALLALACRGIGAAIDDRRVHAVLPERDERPTVLIACGLFAATIAVAAFFERTLLTPEMGIVRAVGLVGGLAVAGATVRAYREHPRAITLGAASIAAVLLGHMQIEVVGVWAGSAPLAACLIGLAVNPPGDSGDRRAGGWIGAIGLVAVGLIVALTSGRALGRWEREMARATAAVEPIASAIADLTEADPGSQASMDAASVIADHSGRRLASSGEELSAQIGLARARAVESAVPGLLAAVEARPAHGPTRQQAVRMLIHSAVAARDQAQRDVRLERALTVARAGTEAAGDRSGSWRLLANTLRTAGEVGPETTRRARIEAAYDALTRAIELDPRGLTISLDLADLADALDRPADAQAWSRRALEINSNFRLDPLRQLTEEERTALERRASGG